MLKLRQLVDLYELLDTPVFGGSGTIRQVLLLAWRYRDIHCVEDMPDDVSSAMQRSPRFEQAFWAIKSVIWSLPHTIRKKIEEIIGY